MIDHVNFDVSDLKESAHFYEKALAPLDIKKVAEYLEPGVVGFGKDRPQFWIVQGDPHAESDEVHICFSANSRKEVDEFYRQALASGGSDNGKPGLRPHYHQNYYGAFVLDPDGYNIEAVCHRPE